MGPPIAGQIIRGVMMWVHPAWIPIGQHLYTSLPVVVRLLTTIDMGPIFDSFAPYSGTSLEPGISGGGIVGRTNSNADTYRGPS